VVTQQTHHVPSPSRPRVHRPGGTRVAETITACSLSGFCCPGRERTLLFAPLLDLDDRAIPQHGSFATRPQHRAIPQHGALDEPQPRLLTHPAWGGVVHVMAARQEGRTADLLLATSRTLFHLESPPSACGRASCPFWPAAAAVAAKPVSSLFLPAWPPPRRGVEPRTTPVDPRTWKIAGPDPGDPTSHEPGRARLALLRELSPAGN
jgi:hypothetical protein